MVTIDRNDEVALVDGLVVSRNMVRDNHIPRGVVANTDTEGLGLEFNSVLISLLGKEAPTVT